MFSEIIESTREVFEFLEPQEAEDIYKLRFDQKKISNMLAIAKKYSQEEFFLQCLGKYIDYCFKYRDGFRLSHTESNNLFPIFIEVSNLLSIPKSSIRINTRYGDFSKIIESIDGAVAKKKQTNGKAILHYVFNFSTPSETFIRPLQNKN